jgi:bifunctional non-homologous end joining protein LigD
MADPAGPAATGLIPPMLATSGPVPSGAGWAFEIKFDGVRAIGYARSGGLRLFSRNDRDVSRSYPEVAALDVRGRPDFGLLQQRMHVMAPSAALLAAVPAAYVVFDLLRHGGQDLLDAPYVERRARLAALGLDGPGMTVPANFVDTPGELVMAGVRQQGLEGVVAKRLTARYEPGRRSRAWIKTPIRHTAEVVVAGWSPSSGNAGVLGSLLLGAHDADGLLVYVGDVGTGFTEEARRRLLARLHPLHRPDPPFPAAFARARGWPGRPPARGPVHWVEPVLVGEIEYRTFTREGNFRHPSWRGLRPDREPADAVLPGGDH